MYAELYDLRTEDISNGSVKRTKARVVQLNEYARSCITCSKEVTSIIYKIDEEGKFDYLQAVLNMELQCASKYSKLIESDPAVTIQNLQESMSSYSKAREFINEYKTAKKIATDADMKEDLRTQAQICDEMIQLIPQKIDRINQELHAKRT